MVTKQIFSILTIQTIFCFAAQQSQYPQLPQKDELQQEILKSEPFESRQLFTQIAPLIAEYADNTVKGYLTLSEVYYYACPSGCHATDYEEWNEFHQQKFGRKLFYYPQSIMNNETKSRINWMIMNIYCGFKPEEVSASDFKKTGVSDKKSIFPQSILEILIQDKKEGDEVNFTFKGVPFVLTCNQRALNPENPQNFEDVLSKTEHNLP